MVDFKIAEILDDGTVINVHRCPGSSVISQVRFNAADEKLDVQFKNGSIYTYHNVSKNRFTRLCKSESIGRYFAQHIKSQYYCVGPRDFEVERRLNEALS